MGLDPYVQKINFDWIEPARTLADPRQPGRGPAAGPELPKPGAGPQWRRDRRNVTQVRDGIYLIDVVARAERTSARPFRPCERSSFPCRTDARAADATRLVDLRAGVPADLAAGSACRA